MAVNFIVLTIGAFWFWPRFIGTICNCFLSCCHGIGVGFLFAGALNPYPRICSYNKSTSSYEGDYEWNYEGMTYEREHGMMFFLGVLQFIIMCAQCCCCCLPLCCTPAKDDSGKKELKQMRRDIAAQQQNVQMQQQW